MDDRPPDVRRVLAGRWRSAAAGRRVPQRKGRRVGLTRAKSLARWTQRHESGEAGEGGGAPAPECVRPEGVLATDGSLEGRVGDYRLTMVEEVDGTPTRRVQGSLVLLTQVESFRQFEGSAGGSIPGVTSPLFGSTDVNVEAVGAVRVGSLSSQDPASPGVLVIESETGTSPSILLRLGSDANRRDVVRFDGGYAVLAVVEITAESFSGTWSSGARGPGSEGFFCATQGR